ncbi:LAME_0H14554g1_1 [Lachancea meyersii CBS 8951]|uniref:LAME_0H14554g1_1 n=1 Tax=Lachancea meyersii CBS 8951 TaxID=1266667 RepID=A0A1G4KHB7_9SACH|nr:LAME_0H14554g1_1 [Lachancea meyersii CBS 8951]
MIKFRAFTKKLSGSFDGSNSTQKRSVSDYDRKPANVKSNRSLLRRRAVSSTREIDTKLPPLPKQEYVLSGQKTGAQHTGAEHTFSQGSKISSNGKYYIYDSTSFEASSKSNDDSVDPSFHILQIADGINPVSAREVLSALIKHFKETLIQHNAGEIEKDTSSIKAAMEIFKPNLSHYVPHEIKETEAILESLFPRAGCSLAGDALDSAIKTKISSSKSKLILSLRILWSRLPRGIVPWESYLKFCTVESKQNFSKMCFRNFMPQILPDSDYTRCAFEFIDLLLAIISKVDLVVDKVAQMDLIFTAAQVVFVKTPELLNYINRKSDHDDDCITLAKLYRARGEALYRLFVSFLNSLAEEGEIKDFYLIDNFRINEYPPKPYKPLTQRALTLTIPQLWDPEINSFNELIRVSAKAQTRMYSSHHAFSKLENSFLDKYEDNPYKVVSTLFSRSSKRYLDKFDPSFDAEFFKTLVKKNAGNSTLGPGDQLPVATWINSCKESGFNDFLSVLDDNNHGEGTLALGYSFPKVNNEDSERLPPLRVSKVDISESFISSWKYETFLGKVHNTLVIKLTKRVGDCEWLIIAMDDRTDKEGYTAPFKPREPSNASGKSSVGSVGRKSHAASTSDPIAKPRPPPPILLGEPSSSPLISSANGRFADQPSSGFSSRPSSGFSTSFAKAHMKTSSTHSRKVSACESPLQHSSPMFSAKEVFTPTTPKSKLSPRGEQCPNVPSTIDEGKTDAKDREVSSLSSSHPSLPGKVNEADVSSTGRTALENLADTFKNDKKNESSKSSIVSGVEGKLSASEVEQLENDSQLSEQIPISDEEESTEVVSTGDNASSTPLPALLDFHKLEDTISTPFNRDAIAHDSPIGAQNSFAGSPESVTIIPHTTNTTINSTETTQVDVIEDHSDKGTKSDAFPESSSKSLSGGLQSKMLQHDEGTDNLLNDLLENYNTLSAEPINQENGPTVFERVKVYYEQEGYGKSAAQTEIMPQEIVQQQEPSQGEISGTTTPATQFSKIGSMSSRNGTWFSCNVTPPNKPSKIRNFKNLKLGSIKRAQPQVGKFDEIENNNHIDEHDADERDTDSDQGDGLLYESVSENSEIPDQDGVWLEASSKPSSPVELISPSHITFRNVMMRTKRSLRNLKANQQQ